MVEPARQDERSPFEPIGKEARHLPLYRIYEQLPDDGIITFDQIQEQTGDDVRGEDRWLHYHAANRLLRDNKRAMVSVRGQGYQKLDPDKHEVKVHEHWHRGKRQTDRALVVIKNADFASMSLTERNRLQNLEARVKSLSQSQKRVFKDLDRKATDMVDEVRSGNTEMREEINALRDLVNKLVEDKNPGQDADRRA